MITTTFKNLMILVYVVEEQKWISTKKESSNSDQWFSRFWLL